MVGQSDLRLSSPPLASFCSSGCRCMWVPRPLSGLCCACLQFPVNLGDVKSLVGPQSSLPHLWLVCSLQVQCSPRTEQHLRLAWPLAFLVRLPRDDTLTNNTESNESLSHTHPPHPRELARVQTYLCPVEPLKLYSWGDRRAAAAKTVTDLGCSSPEVPSSS